MKNINDFTIKEYKEYVDILEDKDHNPFELLKLFGIENADKLKPNEFEKLYLEVLEQRVTAEPIKEFYNINGKRYKFVSQIKDINAAQYIDYQSYMKNFSDEKILSIFLLPTKKTIFNKDKVLPYNDGYDILEVQENLLNNMKMKDAYAISDFFLILSMRLTPIFQGYLEALTMENQRKKNKKVGKKTK